jgi:ATP-binding cassette, subfamily C, bacteriocin exporter
MKKIFSHTKKFILQKDFSYCGVACIQNILNSYKINISAEKIQGMCGTGTNGTTMFGLSEAANQLGFLAQGAEVNSINDLKTIENPCILYTINENRHHYIVLYRWDGKKFIIGDPATGLISLSELELSAIWEKKILLLLYPTDRLQQTHKEKKLRWKWMLSMVRKYLNIMLIVAILGILLAILNLSTAIFSQKLVDKLLASSDHQKIYLSVLLLGLILFFKGLINYIRGLILSHQSKSFNTELTVSFYERILQLPKTFFDSRKTGDMVSRLNDTNRIQQTVSILTGDVSIQVLLLLASLVIITIYSKVAGIVSLLFLPVIFFIVRKFQPEISAGQKETMCAYATNESNYIDNIKGIGIIKLFNRQYYFLKKAKEVYASLQEKVFTMAGIRVRFNLIVETAAALFLGCLITTCVTLVLNKQLMAGEMIAILQLGIIIMQTSTTICLTNIQLQEARVAFERISEFVSIEPESAVTAHSEKIIETENSMLFKNVSILNLDFGFPGQKLLLKNLSLQINMGEITAITGESGQGKSTLFQILQKFYKNNRGSILINGKNLEEYNTKEWRNVVGVVTQDPVLFSGTVAENIILDRCTVSQMKEVIEFGKITGFHQYLNKLPHGYETMVGEAGLNISGGQKQLICLARCLYHKPQLLLLDEPTSAMDKHTELFITNLLEHVKIHSAIVIISHKDSLTNIADNIYEMCEGLLKPVKTTSDKIIYLNNEFSKNHI